MFRFILRMAGRAAKVKRMRFISLALTMATASSLLIILTSLYINAEKNLSMDVSGIPNMVIQPNKDLLNPGRLYSKDVRKLKKKEHFWRNNIYNATPILETEALRGDEKVNTAGTWLSVSIQTDGESYSFGLLNFDGWKYRGDDTLSAQSVVVGANVEADDTITLTINGNSRTFEVAGTIETGSYWDDYIFMNLNALQRMTGRNTVDKILVSALIKPKDQLARKVQQYGTNALEEQEFEEWYCSPYPGSIAYAIEEVLPEAEVRIQRRITEVQGGIIKASTGIFFALFILTLASSLTAIFSAEKMYVTSHLADFRIMAAIGASRKKIFLQLILELALASLLSAVVAYGISAALLNLVSHTVFGIAFTAQRTLMTASLSIPFLIAFTSLLFVRKGLNLNTTDLLRN